MVFQFESGGMTEVEVWLRRFTLWRGCDLPGTYGGKALVEYQGQPVFAELAMLYALREQGFDGVWVDCYRRCFRNQMEADPHKMRVGCALPASAQTKRDEIVRAVGKPFRGWFDVFAWKGEEFLFVEMKRLKRDRIRQNQVRWLEAALSTGLAPASFRVCEWEVEP